MAEVAASTCLTLREIENELSEVTATDWYPLGVQLGLRPPTLREILNTYPLDTERCKQEVLHVWLRSTPEASWKSLAQAVQALGRYESLAQKLRRKVPPAPKGELSSTSSGAHGRDAPTESRHSVEEESAPAVKRKRIRDEDITTQGKLSSMSSDVHGRDASTELRHSVEEESAPAVKHKRICDEDITTQDEVEKRVDTVGNLEEEDKLRSVGHSEEEDELSSAGDSEEEEETSSAGDLEEEEETDPGVQIGKRLLREATTYNDMDSFHWHLGMLEMLLSDDDRKKRQIKESVLCYAAYCGSTPVVEALIERGVDINSMSTVPEHPAIFYYKREISPLHWAAAVGQLNSVKFLVEKGANLHSEDKYGNTPLHEAARNGHTDTVQCLIDKGAGINIKNSGGWTPLHEAARWGHVSAVEYLIQLGGDINVKDDNGWTPLQCAAIRGKEGTVQFLAEKGAEINTKDNDGKTPLDWATEWGQEAVVTYLKRAADPNMLNESESTGRQQEQRLSPQPTDNSPSKELQATIEKEETQESDHEEINLQVKKLLEKYHHQPKIKHKSLKCLFTGPPRVGKTALKKRLLRVIKNLITSGVVSPSGGLEKPISVIIGETRECVPVVMEADLDWQPQHDLLDEAQIVLEFIDKSHHQSPPTPGPTLVPNKLVSPTALSSKSSPDLLTSREGEADTLDDAKKLMQEVLSSRKLRSIKDIEKTTTLYFIDTGGQPEFHEIMPIILNGPALHLIFFNLAFDLNEPIPIRFCHQDGTESTITYVSSYTGKQMIFQLLSSLYYFSKSLSPDSEPAAVLIGTHLDQLKEQDEMKINDYLNRLLNNVEFHDQGFLTYPTRDKSTIFIPVNNYSGDKEEIHQLQAFLRQIIGDRFSPVELPSSWLIFHLLLRHRYENSPGVCKLVECKGLARGCGLDEDDVPQVLRYIHQHLGTILFYEDVSGLNELVICDPNVLFKSIYQLVAVSFGGDKGYHTIAAEIRKTGEIHARVMKRISTQSSSSLLKNEHIIELLMHFKILTELPSDDGVIYFMPCLLRPNNSFELSCKALQTLYPPPLLVRFKGNYIPMGVFSALVVKLLESSWELDQDKRYRNHIVFNMDDDFSVELIVHPAYLEFRIRITNPTEEDAEEIHQFCTKVCKTVVDTLISALELHAHTKKTKFQLGFYCSGSFQADGQPHFCRLSNQRKINPKTFASSDSPHCQDQCRLPPESTIWLEQWKNKKDTRDQGHASASTPLTVKDIQNELKEMTAEWYQLGVQLEIPPATLNTLERDHPHDARRCMTEVITRCLQNAPECSWAKLAKAVEAMGGYAALAERLRQKMPQAVKSGNKED